MNNEISTRIQEVIKLFDETQDSFSIKTGISRTSISKWATGIVQPSFAYLYKIMIAYPNLNGHWLLTGVGNKILEAGSNLANEPLGKYNTRDDSQMNKLLKTELEKAWSEVAYHKEQVLYMQELLKKAQP